MGKKVLAILIAGIAVIFSACEKNETILSGDSGVIKVSVSFHALKELTETVGGPFVEVSTIIPDGMEAHDFEPKARDMEILSTADIFVYNGLGLESWVSDAVGAAANEKLKVVDSSEGAEPIRLGDVPSDGVDPHLWLSPEGAAIQTANIAKALMAADPKNAETYRRNADELILEMQDMHSEYAGKLAMVKSRSFVTGHAAFAYLCREFGLEQNSVEDVFASGEPNAQKMVELIEYAKKMKVKTIFVEKMVNPALSQTLANEVGAKVETVYTMEGSEDEKTYQDRMRANLEAIFRSLSE